MALLYPCENLWWTCSIRNNMQRLVSTIQEWWSRPQQQRPWKTTKRIWRCRIVCIAGRRFKSNPTTIGKIIGSWTGNYFQTLTCHWKNLQQRKWFSYELKQRHSEKRRISCEILVDRFKRKSLLQRIITGDEKCIYFDNPQRKKSYVNSA